MAKLDDKCKLCRRQGEKLFLKGDRCFTAKCAIVKRKYSPGQHGSDRPGKLTDYGRELRDKQAAKRLYGLSERQFSNYVKKAMKKRENTNELLVRYLESRLDNAIFRLGFVVSRAAARQFVGHGFVYVNGEKVNIPSYQVRPKDIITVNPVKVNKKILNDVKERIKSKEFPAWMHFDKEKMEVKVIDAPRFAADEKAFNVQSVVEFYSR